MIAVLGWCDGFGNDTYVNGIYPTIEEAKKHYREGLRWVNFEFGKVDFDWYDANSFTGMPHKKRRKK